MVRMNPKRFALLVTAFVGTVGAAMYSVMIYPMQNIDHYKERQSINRSGIKQEDIQPGNMRVWRDPFDRPKAQK